MCKTISNLYSALSLIRLHSYIGLPFKWMQMTCPSKSICAIIVSEVRSTYSLIAFNQSVPGPLPFMSGYPLVEPHHYCQRKMCIARHFHYWLGHACSIAQLAPPLLLINSLSSDPMDVQPSRAKTSFFFAQIVATNNSTTSPHIILAQHVSFCIFPPLMWLPFDGWLMNYFMRRWSHKVRVPYIAHFLCFIQWFSKQGNQ